MSDPWVYLSNRFATPEPVFDDADLMITCELHVLDPAALRRAWTEAVSQMSAEQLIDVAKFMSSAAEPTEEPGNGE